MESTKAKEVESQNQLPPHPQQQQKGTTLLRTCFNGLNALSGVGVLSIAYALAQAGWLGLILLFVVAVVSWYTASLLRRCMNSDPLIRSYPDIGERAFGYVGRALVSLFMYLELFLVAVEFLLVEGDNLDKLFPKGFRIFGRHVGGKKGFVLLTALVVLPSTWCRSLGLLAYVSVGGVFASLLLVACVLWVGAVDGVGFHESGVLLNLGGFPIALSMFAFCYCGHAVFPTLYNSMKDRSQFSKVLLICFVTSTITYGSMAVLGYLMYGEDLKSQVTLNLPIRKFCSKLAIYTTLVNPLTKYSVITAPIATAIEEAFPFRNNRCISILIRTVIVMSTVIVALAVPFFGYVMAFIGAFFSVTASMLLPCLCYLRINRDARRFSLELVLIVGILLIGSFVGIIGTYNSVKQIVNHLQN